ncbi:hypothetical protein B0O99DRAFT_644374 [Bisporella sp. PMI_857]|nr:hypothetical protein B0O99DRAFT_644374 [Bisporella sp. PMI_857]
MTMRCTLRCPALLALTLLTTLITYVLAQIESVSIGRTYPHTCVNDCVYEPNWGFVGAIEDALGCAKPVANNCYCATASASVSAVDSWLSSCATASCGKGDVSDDVIAMKSVYASYCLQAGFTAPVISTWYTPATTTASSYTPTTTQLTIVTQTAPPSNSGSGTHVTVYATSTQWVSNEGSNIPAPASQSGPNKVALRAGLGVGIPAFIVLVGVGVWLCRRRRRDTQPPMQEQWPQYLPSQDGAEAPSLLAQPGSPPSAATPVASPVLQKTELAGGEGVRREISSVEVHPFPIINPSQPVAVPGNHELYAQNTGPELPEDISTPGYQLDRPSGKEAKQRHKELP